MSWQLLQEVEPQFEWLTLGPPIVGEPTLKIEQDWSYAGAFPGRAYITVVQQFPDGSLYGFRRFYPYRDPRLFNPSIPNHLEASGWNVYSIRLKVNLWGQWQADANWRIRIYEWIGNTPPAIFVDPGVGENNPSTPDLIYDGGQEV
ncbi:hypothetical protein D0962_35725 [Leptolyngbyaceae cyanobacterium CCMR0082]|uniref:Uncharacterized protein n=1 Tax=Adonisia turfae CCMR0082 TaxID=2304604 RepID=A0A6M0SJ75_9CYAN|nr:hypothetical protein [Adonisia turfae]MDV3352013.1 hypothetical protein [Leptothoe sp. LEGE 181152]NEZ68023.1 hypothetical protein [Adonisia turfae CCMR0082]